MRARILVETAHDQARDVVDEDDVAGLVAAGAAIKKLLSGRNQAEA